MKKYLLPLVLSVGLQADIIDSVEIGLEGWFENSIGTYNETGLSTDLENMNLEDALNPSFYIDIKTPSNINFKFQYSSIQNEGTAGVNTQYTSTIFDTTLYINLLNKKPILGDNFDLDLDLGFDLRYFDSDLTGHENFGQFLPMGYAKGQFNLANTDLAFLTQVLYTPQYGTNLDTKVGFLYTMFDSLNAEVGYRYNKARVDDTYRVNIITDGPYIGFSYKFGGEDEVESKVIQEEVIVVVEEVESDSDNDGIIDENDSCKNTKENSSVNSIGCAPYQLDDDKDGVSNAVDLCLSTLPNIIVDENGCMVDADKDSVTDAIDLCPNTDANLSVNEQGCAKNQLDTDKDGVKDDKDLCPHTVVGTNIDETGCEKIVINIAGFEDIQFEHGSSKLTDESKSTLDRLAKDLREHANYNVNVEGHTSNGYRTWKYKKVPSSVKGEESIKRYLNTKISQKRANTVKKYLVSIGTDSAVITAIGHGPDKPKASNDTKEGRAKNRRVEIIIDTLERK